MTSAVACIGFTEPGALASIVRADGQPFHELSSTTKWSDSSGATLLLDRAAQTARPGFMTPLRTPYQHVEALESGLARVHLVDSSGMRLDSVNVIPAARYTVGWAAAGQMALVALGLDAEFFETAEDFFDSPRSAMPDFDGEPPPEVKQFGLPWPPAMEIESFLPRAEEAIAVLSGTVQNAEVRTNSRTHHEFLVARVSTVFGNIDVCTPVPVEGAPQPGQVAVATVQLTAVLPPHGALSEPEPDQLPEPVPPNFRAGEETDAVVLDPADVSLPDGLVLGDDGIVRTEDEHRTWRSSTPQASAPSTSTPPDNSGQTNSQFASADPNADSPDPSKRRGWRARFGRP